MLQIFKTKDRQITEVEKFLKGTWVSLIKPTTEELDLVVDELGADPDLLKAALDREESSRIEVEDDGQVLIIVDIPVIDHSDTSYRAYQTIPLGILVLENQIVTVCLEENEVLSWFLDGKVKNFATHLKTRFIMQMLRRNAVIYLRYLRLIDQKTNEVEQNLHRSMQNRELIQLMELQKSLVYFTASLKANGIVLDRLEKVDRIGRYTEADADFLEDAIIDNDQALEMANIYSGTLGGTMDAFASIIANNQNAVMKLLAGMTIILNVPAMIFAFYGMNVTLPGGDSISQTFWIPLVLSVVLSIAAAFVFIKKKFFE